MSADNWTKCPQCAIQKAKQADELDAIVRKSYGKIPSEEYMKLVTEAANVRASLKSGDDSLREDYEIGVRRDKFAVDYYASCTVCGWDLHFKHSGDKIV